MHEAEPPRRFTLVMKTSRAFFFLASLACSPLLAEEEPWLLADGSTVQGSFRGAMPGTIILTGKDGTDLRVPVAKLSPESKKRVAALIGLDQPAAVAPPSASAPSVSGLGTAARDPGALDATNVDLIFSKLGLKAVVIGVVDSVVVLGSTGHQKLRMQDTEFEVFLPKQVVEKSPPSGLDGLKGKTIQITGTISKYGDKPQVSLRALTDLAVVE